MSYDVTQFADYVGRENDFLTASLFSGGDTGKFARFMTGVKGKDSIPNIDGTATIQKGTCIANPAGTTEITEYFIEVQPWSYKEAFCNDDLQNKFPSTVLAPGSNNQDAPPQWQETVVDVKTKSIQEQLELTYWQGDTAGSYTLFDGFIKKIDADGNAIAGNTTAATAITKANVIGLVDDMITASPAKTKRHADYEILVGDDVFDMYIQAQKEANNYHYDANNDGDTYKIGGSNKVLRRVYGLDGTDRMFAGRGGFFVVGMDVEEESNVIKIWYSDDDDVVYFQTKAKSGVTPVHIEELVEFTLAV